VTESLVNHMKQKTNKMQGWIQEFALGEVRPLSPPLPLRSRVPLKPAKGICGSAVSCPSAVHGRAPAENKFGAFSSCEKATGGNHFEYSEVHVLEQNDQNLAQEYRHGVGPSSAVRPEAARTRCKSTTETDKHKAHTHTHPFNGPFSGTTQVSHYQKGKNQSGFC